MLKIIIFSLCLSLSSVRAQEDHGHKEHEKEHGEVSSGFRLSSAAVKKFELSYVDYRGAGTLISLKAVFRGLSEVNLYRLRDGSYKRVDFKVVEKNQESIKVMSDELTGGDKIVVSGIGFLRIAELAATGGLSDSHSH